jgi:hypothetical protein
MRRHTANRLSISPPNGGDKPAQGVSCRQKSVLETADIDESGLETTA